MAVRLGDCATGRDNNFNLIRLVAATAVLVSHAWPITGGKGTAEPLTAITGVTLGSWAVAVFFAISGFLVCASFERSASARSFVMARALRIFPGLAVSALLVALVLGPAVTTLATGAYLSHPATWEFIIRNATAIKSQYTLPGVFAANPFPAVEGSIWTLVHEIASYLMLLGIGLLGLGRRSWVGYAGALAYAAFWLAPQAAGTVYPGRLMDWRELSLPFVIGMAAWRWRHRIVLGPVRLGVVLGAAWIAWDGPLQAPMMALAVVYAALCAAYLPRGRILGFNRLGDYSYGLYIYAFPLQGLAVWAWGPMTPAANIALALPATLLAAVLSWHLVERPALRLRQPRPTPKHRGPRAEAPGIGARAPSRGVTPAAMRRPDRTRHP